MTEGGSVTMIVRAAAIDELRRQIRGEIIRPADAGYHEARSVYNTIHNRWPALVLRAADENDVVTGVQFARSHGLIIAVRGGNHSMPGFGSCDDGLVLDLGGIRRVDVDPHRRIVSVAGGCTWADVNDATHRHGLATTGGLISTTGVGGLTLGGGIGYLARLHGLACDNLIAADVVTADGDRLRATTEEHADLLWALRGGGGNFGVVTSFEFRLHDVGEVIAGPIVFPLSADVVRAWGELVRRAPTQLGTILGLTLAPTAPFVPDAWHGKPAVVVIVCWTGPRDQADTVLREFDDLGPAIGQSVGPMPYPVVNTLFDSLLPRGMRHYWRSHIVPEMPGDALEALVSECQAVPSAASGVFFYPIDGACHHVSVHDSAFPHREARFAIGVHGDWWSRDDDTRGMDWVRACDAALHSRHSSGSRYVNFASDDGRSIVESAYGPNHERLAAVKRRYDPHNVFCLNHNIDPDASVGGEDR